MESTEAPEAVEAAPTPQPARWKLPLPGAQTWLGLVLLAVVLAAAAYWLQSDDRSNPYSIRRLTAMLVIKEEAAPEYARLSFAPDYTGRLTDDDYVADAFTGAEAARIHASLIENDWARSVIQSYALQTNTPVNSGPVYLFSQVDFFRHVDGAANHFQVLQEIPLHAGETSRNQISVMAAEHFNPGQIGDQATGYVSVTSYEAGDLGRVTVYNTVIVFRRGQIIGKVGVDRADGSNATAEVARLAQALDARIRAAAPD